MLSPVCTLKHYACSDTFEHPTLAPFSPLSFIFFGFQMSVQSVESPCARQNLPYLSTSQLAAEEFPSVGLNSEMLTQIICPMKNGLTRLICGSSHHPLPCRALQQRTSKNLTVHNMCHPLLTEGPFSPV